MRSPNKVLSEARNEVLQQLEEWLDLPMLVLSFVWLMLFVIELIWGLNPVLDTISPTIWLLLIANLIANLLSDRQARANAVVQQGEAGDTVAQYFVTEESLQTSKGELLHL